MALLVQGPHILLRKFAARLLNCVYEIALNILSVQSFFKLQKCCINRDTHSQGPQNSADRCTNSGSNKGDN